MSEMDTDGTIFVGKSDKPEFLTLALANRHGLVTGATGTGKTVTLQVLAEGLSRAGVPVFAADIKGDLSGIAEPGEAKEPFVDARQEPRLRLRARPVPGRVLGPVRRAGPSDPRHHLGDGAAAAVAAARSQRRAGGRAQHRLPRRRRAGAAAARPQGPARDARLSSPSMRPSSTTAIRQRVEATVGTIQRQLLVLENQGGDQVLRRAGAGAEGLHAAPTATAAASSTSWPPTS